MRQRLATLSQFFAVALCTALVPGAAAGPVNDANVQIKQLPFSAAPPIARLGSPDTDLDGIVDVEDNCLTVANPDQTDSNSDGIGNACDADLNQDCVVNVIDLGILRSVFFTADPNADFNGDGVVNVVDLGLMRSAFFTRPGPSAISNSCGVNFTINGRVRGATLPNATISARINGADYDTTFIFNTTLQPDGTYALPIFAPTSEDFVTLRAAGSMDQTIVRLESDAGSAGRLDDAGGNDGTVDSAEASAVDISALSSAATVLAREENGGPMTSDSELDAALVKVDSAWMTDLAVLIKFYVDVPSLVLPESVDNTFALIEDPSLRQLMFDIFVTAFGSASPNGLSEDFADEQSRSLTVPFTAMDVPETLYLFNNDNLQAVGADVVELRPDNTGTYTDLIASGSGTWALASDGTVQLDVSPPIVNEDVVVFVEDPANPGNFIEVRRVTQIEQVQLRRVIDGALADHIHSSTVERSTFPENPELPDIVTPDLLGRANAKVGFAQSSPFPYSAAELGGSSLVMTYFHRDNASEGNAQSVLGADILDFVADGTGQTRRRGFDFTWTVSATDGLHIAFDNGDTNQLDYFGDDQDGQKLTVLVANLGSTGTFAARSNLLEPDCASGCDQTALEDARWRSALSTKSTSSRPFNVFDFMLNGNLTACRNPGNSISSWTWAFQNGRMELERAFASRPDFFFYRTWQPFVQTPAGFYVIETLQVADNEPQLDAGVTPGRLNFYSREQNLLDNQRPTLGNDAITIPNNSNATVYFDVLTLNDVDPEGDEVIVRDADFVSANGGTLTQLFNPLTGLWVGMQYTPPPGFVGVDTFDYRASDLLCFSDPTTAATVSITVSP